MFKKAILILIVVMAVPMSANADVLVAKAESLLNFMRHTVQILQQEPDYVLADQIQTAPDPLKYKKKVFKRLYYYAKVYEVLDNMVKTDYIFRELSSASQAALVGKRDAFAKMGGAVDILYKVIPKMHVKYQRRFLMKLAYL
jgi:hypothetical protein